MLNTMRYTILKIKQAYSRPGFRTRVCLFRVMKFNSFIIFYKNTHFITRNTLDFITMKWKVKDVWSILVTFEKDCPYCFGRQYLSKKTINAMPELISLPLHFLFPFLVHLSDEGPLDWYRKK